MKHLFMGENFVPQISKENEYFTKLRPGTYDAMGNMLKSWQQLIDDGDFVISSNDGQTHCAAVNRSEREYPEAKKLVLKDGIVSVGQLINLDNNSSYSNIEEIIFPDTVQTLSIHAFGGSVYGSSKIKRLHIPKNAELTKPNPYYGFITRFSPDLEEITVDVDNPYYTSGNNWNAIVSKNMLVDQPMYGNFYAGCKESIIPEGVTLIWVKAFCGHTKIKEISLPNSLIEIRDGAFEYCSGIESILIPNNVRGIGNSVFLECTSLQSVILPSSLRSIGTNAFTKCTSLEEIVFQEVSTAPSSITGIYINSNAFDGCSALKTISIPSYITSIASTAFKRCPNLETIHYSGTASGAPWGAVNATVVP